MMNQRISEGRIAAVETLTTTMDVKQAGLEKPVSKLADHVDNLENQGCRCNIRIIGLPEDTEGTDPFKFLERWIPVY